MNIRIVAIQDVVQDFVGADVRFGNVTDMDNLRAVAFKVWWLGLSCCYHYIQLPIIIEGHETAFNGF
jgi:hypothetical protein